MVASMRRSGIVAVLAVAYLLLPSPARADGLYFSESFGGSAVRDELGAYMDGAFRIRVALGFRSGRTAVEAWLGGDIGGDDGYAIPEAQEPDPFTYGIDVKRLFPMSKHIELYVRGSASRMSIDSTILSGYSGRGLGVGTGVQVKGKVPVLSIVYPPYSLVCFAIERCRNWGPKATIALFADQGYDFYRLHGGNGRAVDAQVTRWTLGFAIGGDF